MLASKGLQRGLIQPLLALRAPIHCVPHESTSSHVAQFQRVAVTYEHLSPQPRMIRMFQTGIGRKQLLRLAPGLFQNCSITPQIGDSQRRQAVLLRSKQIARAAQLEIHFGQLRIRRSSRQTNRAARGLAPTVHR